jgi:hypothetical protein
MTPKLPANYYPFSVPLIMEITHARRVPALWAATYEGQLQGIKWSIMTGPSDTLDSPWKPHEISRC